MSRFLQIRRLLGMTQQEIAHVIGCVQANVSFLDRGQTITPDVAQKLVAAGRAMGVPLTMDIVYGVQPLPTRPMHRPAAGAQPHDWAAIVADLEARGWSQLELAVRIGVRVATVRALALREATDAPHAVGEALLGLHASTERPAAQRAAAQQLARV